MNRVLISPSALSGRIKVPPSKSAAHRAVLSSALANGVSHIAPIDYSDDICATIHAAEALGAKIEQDANKLTIDGTQTFSNKKVLIDCKESGSTLRFLIPITAARGVFATFTGSGRLPSRPLGSYLESLTDAGICCSRFDGLPLSLSGTLRPGKFTLPGNISSQFITGLLFALPLLQGDSEIILTSKLESSGYVDMTINMLRRYSIIIKKQPKGYFIKGNQRYQPYNESIEGDWSQAAFFMAAGALGAPVSIEGLRMDSVQGDKQAFELLRQFGADVEFSGNAVTVSPASLYGIDIDASQIPDLVPILAVTAAAAQGTTHITGAARLRMKESDRLKSTATALCQLGVDVTELDDGLKIKGTPSFRAAVLDGCNDHRIVMALSIASIRAMGPLVISHSESINKSYPGFFDDFNMLGGNAHVIDMG